LDKLERIRGISFDWNELYNSPGQATGRRELGVFAQEVETVFPELVTTWGSDAYKGVDYGRLTAVLIEGIKELAADVRALKEKVRHLESEQETKTTEVKATKAHS